MKRNWTLTIAILAAAITISIFLWSIGIYFFFIPIIFLPFLKFIKFKTNDDKTKNCPSCGWESEGNYCPRCGRKLF